MKRIIAACLLFVPLAGCSNLLPNLVGEPPALYELRAPEQIASSQPLSTKQLLIDVPMASAGIDTPRVALIQPDGTMAYYRNVSWTDRTPVMLQTMLVEAFGNSGRLPAVGRENVGLRADYLFKTDIVAFEASYRNGAVPTVRVAINAKIITMPRRMIMSGRVFTAEVEAEQDSVLAVRDAFQQASGQVLTELVNWTLGELKENTRQRR